MILWNNYVQRLAWQVLSLLSFVTHVINWLRQSLATLSLLPIKSGDYLDWMWNIGTECGTFHYIQCFSLWTPSLEKPCTVQIRHCPMTSISEWNVSESDESLPSRGSRASVGSFFPLPPRQTMLPTELLNQPASRENALWTWSSVTADPQCTQVTNEKQIFVVRNHRDYVIILCHTNKPHKEFCEE